MAHLKWLYNVFLVALQEEGIHVWIFFHPLPADGEKAPSHSRTEVTGNLTIYDNITVYLLICFSELLSCICTIISYNKTEKC